MERLDKVKEYVGGIVANHCFLPDRPGAFAHLQGVAAACALLAAKRGLDVEISCACGLMHDLYAGWSGSYMQHGPSGAEMARVALRRMGCFSEDGQLLIRSAIYHHSDKKHVHDPYDEVLKDADTLYPFLTEGGPLNAHRYARMRKLSIELGIPFVIQSVDPQDAHPKGFERHTLAGIAQSIAQRHVQGSVGDAVFQDILRYWPEKEAFDELKNAWCAAFVYHCCLLAGMELPIRYPGAGVRFAGVGAWLEWARSIGIYFDGAEFEPDRGDIILYDGIIPEHKKPSGGPWHDHIGIVLSCGADALTVAEGNVGNENLSGIVCRRRREHVGGYIRIPEDYECDCWKYDYKTGKSRIVPLVSG